MVGMGTVRMGESVSGSRFVCPEYEYVYKFGESTYLHFSLDKGTTDSLTNMLTLNTNKTGDISKHSITKRRSISSSHVCV